MTDVYLALDFPTKEEALYFLKKNELQGVPVKIGMELFYREGPKIIEQLQEHNHNIFLDLKLHDIPNTVYRTMKNIAKLQVDFVNVHALGGGQMIKKAKEGLIAGNNNPPSLLAVTVLTSIDEQCLQNDLQVSNSIKKYILHLAKISKEHGADGVVCSALEAKTIKEYCGEKFLTVTPGIRLEKESMDDQERIATPTFARNNQVDFLVVGRPVTQAKNPKKAYQQLLREGVNHHE